MPLTMPSKKKKNKQKRRCRHCRRLKRRLRPKGLCRDCYYATDDAGRRIRDRYPPISKFGRRVRPDRYGGDHLPALPTDTLPGTPEREKVIMDRLEAGEATKHPLDRKRSLE